MTRKQTRQTMPESALAPEDLEELRLACWHLEHPSLAARLSSVVGTPIDVALSLLPRHWYRRVHRVAELALAKAYDTALLGIHPHQFSAHERYYKGLVATSGAMGGLFGLPGLIIELPVTTSLMLRAVAEIARDQGEDVETGETRAACLEVFAFGGRTEIDDAADTGYYGVRLALSSYLSFASIQASHQAVGGAASPALVRLIQAISTRFGAQLSSRAAARVVPVIGAAGAAAINVIFMQHFQDMARGHFTVRRLERQYGAEVIQASYEAIAETL